jgi:hypothetical protein
MWAIRNFTPYKAASSWGRNKDGVHEWLVAVKGTFDIRSDGSLSLADEQLDPLLVPEYTGEPGLSSLLYDTDVVAPKFTTDVLLNATAHAPGGRASTNFLVEARIGAIHKVIRVVGNRFWGYGLLDEHSEPEPVTQVPIVYERAYGGYDHTDADPRHHRLDTRNPVGRGLVAKISRRKGQPLPNLEYPDGALDKAGPAGFGPIDSFWSPRRELAGTYDSNWSERRRPLLPEDWDPLSLLCSPLDQRPDTHLRGGEFVELINLTPTGRLRFMLPKVHISFRTRFGSRTEEHRSRLSSVIIEPEHPRVIMIWQTHLICHNDGDYLDETIVREKRYI